MSDTHIRSLRKLDGTSFGVSLPKSVLSDELNIPQSHEGVHVVVEEVDETEAKLEFKVRVVTKENIF